MSLKEILQSLYNDQSKHSRYQNIPRFVREAMDYTEVIDESWRGDTARYEYIQRTIDFGHGMKVADVGANTGFFTLSLAHDHRHSLFTAYEPNANHSEFIRTVAEKFQLENVRISNQSLGLLSLPKLDVFDLMLHFNVLHHAGFDYDQELVKGPDEFHRYAQEYANLLKGKAKQLLFQVGYNWGGDKTKPIIEVRRVADMVLYVPKLFAQTGWKVQAVALYSKVQGKGTYVDMPESLLKEIQANPDDESLYRKVKLLVDQLEMHQNSEFYKRPIFLFESETTLRDDTAFK
jgi:ABC-type transport system substrate-binding protein